MVTLEKIDEIIERTGCSYLNAKLALEESQGDLLEAIISIEENTGFKKTAKEFVDETKDVGSGIMDSLKEIIRLGNVTRLILEKDNKKVLDIPIVAGAIGAVVFMVPTTVAIVTAILTGCSLKLIKEDGEIVNVNEVTKSNLEDLKNKYKNSFEEKDCEAGSETDCSSESPESKEELNCEDGSCKLEE